MAIRLGIIGLSADQSAWATVAHVGPLKAPPLSDKYTVTALATSSPESAKASAKIHGVSEDKAYHTPEAIASDPDVDMVVVSIKLALHKKMAIPALNAKKQLFVEWPLGNGLKEAEELAALAKKQGVKTAVGLQSRLSPVVVKVSLLCSCFNVYPFETLTSNATGKRNYRLRRSRSCPKHYFDCFQQYVPKSAR